ncbi:MAG: MBOAT family O-acyltransferase [Clostridiales bacterium]|nr:MBOAT family O-acyltransferase [Clostridiales bacterium]
MIEFDFYNSLNYWLVLFVLVLILNFFLKKPLLQRYGFLLANIFMLLALPNFGGDSLLILFVLTFYTFSIGWLLNKRGIVKNNGLRIAISLSSLIIIILVLACFKYRLVLSIKGINRFFNENNTSKDILLIGVSYFSFKMMHFIIASYKQGIKKPNLMIYLNYIFFFPSFISGPINRYNHFCESFDSEKRTQFSRNLGLGGKRIVHGLFKRIVLVQILLPYVLTNLKKPIDELSIAEIIYGLYAYSFYFYFDFSGYTDLAIGCAQLLGVDLPENFNSPFLKRNIQQLWANWHISLTSWLMDYIYWPLVKKMRNFRMLKKRPILLSNLCIIFTFVICGLWHGDGINFLLWGLYHGLGLSALNVYRAMKRRIDNIKINRYFMSKYSFAIGIFLTFNFFSIGLLLFALDIKTIKLLFNGKLFL